MKEYDVIIIGAGMAGLTAAIYAARAGKTVLVLEGGLHGGQIVNSTKVGNWPGEVEISGADLMQKIYHQVNNLGAEVKYEKVVEIANLGDGDSDGRSGGGVDDESGGAPDDKRDEISDDGRDDASGGGSDGAAQMHWRVKTDEAEYACGDIILAMGTKPRELSPAQAASAGERPISYCATCDGVLYKGKTVVVVGSGKTAEHEMKYLANIVAKVLHIHHDESIPEEAEAVFVAIGRVPATEVVRGLVECDADGYIVAGEDCRTSVSHMLVAGDCRTKSVRQLVTAAADGAAAAKAVVQGGVV